VSVILKIRQWSKLQLHIKANESQTFQVLRANGLQVGQFFMTGTGYEKGIK
jgi:hypothetical protein